MSDKRYRPHAFQRKLHASQKRIRVVATGRQTGKTLSGIIELVFRTERGRSDCCGAVNKIEIVAKETVYKCPKCGNACNFKKIKSLVVAPTYKDLDEVNIGMLKDWVPSWFESGWNEQKKKLTHANGSTIRFVSADKPDRLRGGTYDYVWLDEVSFMKPVVWDILQPATLVRQADILLTTTPKGRNWVYKDFFSRASEVWTVPNPTLEAKQEPVFIEKGSGDKEIAAFHYRTYDADHVQIADIGRERARMTEKMFRQEYLATFEEFSGMIYPMLDEKLHFIDYEPNLPMQYFVGVDTGYKNPTAILLVGEDSARNLYVLDEIYKTGMTPSEIADNIKKISRSHYIRDIIVDPASWQGVQASEGVSVADQIMEAGLTLSKANNNVTSGIMRVQELLTANNITGEPKLKIHNRCVNLKEELYSYIWQDSEEKPVKSHDHAVDCLRYIISSRPDLYSSIDEHRNAPKPVGAIDLLENRFDEDLF